MNKKQTKETDVKEFDMVIVKNLDTDKKDDKQIPKDISNPHCVLQQLLNQGYCENWR